MTATLMRFVPQERRPTRASGRRLPPRVSQITEWVDSAHEPVVVPVPVTVEPRPENGRLVCPTWPGRASTADVAESEPVKSVTPLAPVNPVGPLTPVEENEPSELSITSFMRAPP